jgi:hypothetical protein
VGYDVHIALRARPYRSYRDALPSVGGLAPDTFFDLETFWR